ncbi:hypothetical protein ACHAWF_003614 [Thalassiosira exigua]
MTIYDHGGDDGPGCLLRLPPPPPPPHRVAPPPPSPAPATAPLVAPSPRCGRPSSALAASDLRSRSPPTCPHRVRTVRPSKTADVSAAWRTGTEDGKKGRPGSSQDGRGEKSGIARARGRREEAEAARKVATNNSSDGEGTKVWIRGRRRGRGDGEVVTINRSCGRCQLHAELRQLPGSTSSYAASNNGRATAGARRSPSSPSTSTTSAVAPSVPHVGDASPRDATAATTTSPPVDDRRRLLLLRRVRAAFRSTFLPGADVDVLRRAGYLRYAFLDNVQDLSTALRSVLATQRILEGVGVGRSDATALSATLNFVVRDGCGMLASLAFSSCTARSFRRNVKRWKFFADVAVDVGITLEVLAPCVLNVEKGRKWFLPLLCAGNVCKALCGVAAGACGGAMQMHWAKVLTGTEEGISEVAAKSGAQRTVMGGLGLVSAALLAKWLGGDYKTAVILYCALTAVHLMANYQALKLVALDWLNGWRLHLVVEEFLSCASDEAGNVDPGDARPLRVSDPAEASKREPLLFLPERRSAAKQMSMCPVRMGVSFNELDRLAVGRRAASLLDSHLAKKRDLPEGGDDYILAVGRAGGGRSRPPRRRFRDLCVVVAFFSESGNAEKAKAYLHGCLVRRALSSRLASFRGRSDDDEADAIATVEDAAEAELRRLWPLFETCVGDAGWLLDKTECSTEGYVVHIE